MDALSQDNTDATGADFWKTAYIKLIIAWQRNMSYSSMIYVRAIAGALPGVVILATGQDPQFRFNVILHMYHWFSYLDWWLMDTAWMFDQFESHCLRKEAQRLGWKDRDNFRWRAGKIKITHPTGPSRFSTGIVATVLLLLLQLQPPLTRACQRREGEELVKATTTIVKIIKTAKTRRRFLEAKGWVARWV